MQFRDFARMHGVLVRDLVDDGRIRRCPTEAHPRKQNGAYRFASTWGWVQDWASHESPVVWFADEATPQVREAARRDMAAQARIEAARRREAAETAADIIGKASTGAHPYLDRKGFKAEQGLVDFDGRLIVPMRSLAQYPRVMSLQWIDAAGEKRFMPGGATKGAVLMLGVGAELWMCEGYATGLSIRAGLRYLHRPGRVAVCFSAFNLLHVARETAGRRFVFADNDESGTGQRVAQDSGLPWRMPPTVGHDANDMHQQQGLPALAALMRELVM